ncbi:MAG: hypothetical protein VW058_10090, partial [Flavobacteriaceae bacterium]
MNKKTFFSFIVFLFSLVLYPQFGTIGYDFKDPYISFEGLQFAVRLSTNNNIYCPNPKEISVKKLSKNEVVLRSNSLSAAGGQLISEGFIELKIKKGDEALISISARASHPTELGKTILVIIKGIDVESMVSEQPQANGVQVFTKNKGIRVSYPSRAATMPLVFFTSPEKEWYVLSKDREIRRKGFGCSYDHLSDEPVVL